MLSRWLALCLTVVLALACASNKRDAYAVEAAYGDYEEAQMDDAAEYELAGVASKAASRGRSIRAKRAPAAPPPRTAGAPPADPAPVAPETPAPKRMVFYEGSTTLRVARLAQAVDEVSKIAESMGGFVERVDRSRVSLRVPVDRFRESLAAVQTVGDVVDERIHASDVTEAFQDVKLRLDTAKATRERLITLLAKAENEQERLQLIRQIQRLTEQIDQMESRAQTLSRLAAMSRIVVTLQPRPTLSQRGAQDDAAAFRWIRQLSPFGADVVRGGKKLRLDVPEGMVQLDLKGAYVAEAPDGSRIWSGRLKNDVQADAGFWIEAVKERLAEDFASAEVVIIGDYATVRFVQRDDAPYTWVVAVRPDGNDLHVVEAWMSSPEQTERYLPAIEGVLRTGGGVL